MDNSFLIISAITLALYLIVGVFPSSRTGREYFLISNRNLKGIPNGFSIAASKIGGGLLVTYSTFFFVFGWSAFFYFVGIIIGYLIFYKFAKNLLTESKTQSYYTLADYFSHRYGNKVGVVIGVLTTISVFGWILTNLVAGGVLLAEMSGLSSFFTTFSLAIVIGTYLFIGGFNSVVKTDFIQYAALLIIAIVFCFVLYNGVQIDPQIKVDNIPIGKIIGFILLGIFFPMGSAELWQRVYASNSPKDLKRSILIASFSYILLGTVVSLICIAITNANILVGKPDATKLAIGVKELTQSIHPALPIIWLIAYLSAIISSADTFVYTTASSIVQDIVEKSNKSQITNTIKNIRITIILLLMSGLIISLVYPNIVGLTILFVGITLVISGISYFSLIKRIKINPATVIISATVGSLFVFVHFFISGGKSIVVTSLIGIATTSLIFGVYALVTKIRKTSG